MRKKDFNNLDEENSSDLVTKKKNPAVFGLLIFFAVIGVIALLVWVVVLPVINKNLSNIGIKSVNDFIDFYKEINEYVYEGDVVTNPFGPSDYNTAYASFVDSNLTIFEDDIEPSDISEEKIDEYKEIGFPNYGTIVLSGKQLASLISNALKNENLIKQLDVEIIEKYKLSLEIKELTVNTVHDQSDVFEIKTVGKISLKDVANSLPWPYNGMVPDSIYITVKSKIKYDEENVTFSNCEIKINKISDETQKIVIDVINSQIKDKDVKPITIEELSENVNKIIYEKLESFASLLSGKIKIVLNSENEAIFELNYAD